MTLVDTLLVDGTDLASITGLTINDLSGLHAPGTRRGGNLTYPGVDGDVYVEKFYAAYSFDVLVTLEPLNGGGVYPSTDTARRAQLLANLRDLEGLLNVGLVTLTRRFAAVGGGYTDHTCNGEYVAGLGINYLNAETGRTVLQFVNLDGYWSDGLGGKFL